MDAHGPSPDPVAVARRTYARGGWATWTAWLLLAARMVGFLVCQIVIAIAHLAGGHRDPWMRSAAWWPISASVTSIVTLAVLVVLLRREGRRYRDLLRHDRASIPRDLLLTLGLVVVAAVLALGPNLGLSWLLYGDAQTASTLFLRPLPAVVLSVALVAFPLTMAASELPLYAGYLQPRIEVITGRRWFAVLLVAGALALQHLTLPLLTDWRFVIWRALMFLPFAILAIGVLRWRPRLLPYLVGVHLLADFAAVAQLTAAP